jgi:hydroxymethylglutaryl-CoA reductase
MNKSSRLSGFYQLSCEERAAIVAEWAELTPDERRVLQAGLSLGQASFMIENVIGLLTLPLGIATNFCIKDEDVLVPMAVEEPSIVAAVSFAARLARAGGGFRTGSSESVMIGQVQLLDLPRHDLATAAAAVRAAEADILAAANHLHPSIQARGGGARGLEVRPLPDTRAGPMLIVHLLFDTRDAMGANAVNTAVEAIAPLLETLTGGRALLRILSNLSDQRQAWAEVTIPVQALATTDLAGARVAQGIVEANAFAVADPYRAATHNKGIMNGIDAVALATGNDWRALEAGAHAYAARRGQYRGLTDWQLVPSLGAQAGAELYGRLQMPLAVGVVGGATKAHPTAQVALKILGQPSARRLAEIMVAVGLAQNLAAMRALVTDGIQRGHMALHARQVALAAGAQGDEVSAIAVQLVREGQIRQARAEELVRALGDERPSAHIGSDSR